jgi:hypothetical protein
VWACGQRESGEQLAERPPVEVMELGRIGGRIYNEPERTLEILDGAGLSPASFERQVRDLKSDSALARAYALGFQAVVRPRPPSTYVAIPGPALPGAAPAAGAFPGAASDTLFVGPTRPAPRVTAQARPRPRATLPSRDVPQQRLRIPIERMQPSSSTEPGPTGSPAPTTQPVTPLPPTTPLPPDTTRRL